MPEYLSRDRKAVPDEALIVDQVPEPRPADHEYASHADPLRDVVVIDMLWREGSCKAAGHRNSQGERAYNPHALAPANPFQRSIPQIRGCSLGIKVAEYFKALL